MSDLTKMTIPKLKEYAANNNIKIPSGLKKDDIIQFLNAKINENPSEIKEPVKFISNIEPRYMNGDWLTSLYTQGWAVVPIPGWKVEFVTAFFDFLETCCSDFKKTDPLTWKPENLPILSRGVLLHYIGHCNFVWEIRELCAPIFAKMWGVNPEDLISSFDGGCFLTPKRVDKFVNWVHVDTPRDPTGTYNFNCVQGIVNFLDNDAKDGGLVLVEGSNTIIKEYMDKHPSEGISWGMADMNDPLLNQRKLIKICAPAGHIILFDSRTFHCNIPPSGSNVRICTYVCMQPRIVCSQEELLKRQKLYEEGRMTGHALIGKYSKVNPKDPNTRGAKNNKPSKLELAPLNPLRSRLIGY